MVVEKHMVARYIIDFMERYAVLIWVTRQGDSRENKFVMDIRGELGWSSWITIHEGLIGKRN